MAQIGFNIPSIAFIIAVIGLTWAAFLALHRKGNQSANRYLALLIGVLTVFVLRRDAIIESDGPLLYLYFVSHSLIFIIGPSIFLHVATLTRLKPGKVYPHFIPFMVMGILLSGLYFYRETITAIQDMSLLKGFALSLIAIQVVHVIGYLFRTRKLIQVYEAQSQNQLSTVPDINLKWSKGLLIVASILGGGIFLLSLLIITGGYYSINNTADGLFLITILIILGSLILKSWNHPEVIYNQGHHQEKYKQSPLSNPEIVQLQHALEDQLRQRIYLRPDLTLQELAEAINTKPYLLSQLLNESYHQNFFSFINQRRIDFAKLQIQKGFLDKQTVEALAYTAGFNSKSTFNRAFRKMEGQSPREFLKKEE